MINLVVVSLETIAAFGGSKNGHGGNPVSLECVVCGSVVVLCYGMWFALCLNSVGTCWHFLFWYFMIPLYCFGICWYGILSVLLCCGMSWYVLYLLYVWYFPCVHL